MHWSRWTIAALVILAIAELSLCFTPVFADDDGQESPLSPAPSEDDPRNTLGERWRLIDQNGDPLKLRQYKDPWKQSPAKGDFPFISNDVFGVLTFLYVPRLVTVSAGDVDPTFVNEYVMAAEVFHGATVFKPKDWSLKAAGKGFFNRGQVDVESFGVLELFGELKLFDVSRYYDFTSVRAGVQFFKTDFNGFIFQDFNLGGALFGELGENRYRWSAAFSDLLAKEDGVNTFDSQNEQVAFANFFVEDFLKPGFDIVFSAHYNHDESLQLADTVLSEVDVAYFGVDTDRNWGRVVVRPSFYFVTGTDKLIGNVEKSVSAFYGGLRVEYLQDYLNYRTAFFIASGDSDPFDDEANGFDVINDNIVLLGGPNSFMVETPTFSRPKSFIPSNQGFSLSRFENPGMMVLNAGIDAVFTPKTFFGANVSWFQFLDAGTLLQVDPADPFGPLIPVTTDTALGLEINAFANYRILLNENLVFQIGGSVFLAQQAAKDILLSQGVTDETVFTSRIALLMLY